MSEESFCDMCGEITEKLKESEDFECDLCETCLYNSRYSGWVDSYGEGIEAMRFTIKKLIGRINALEEKLLTARARNKSE